MLRPFAAILLLLAAAAAPLAPADDLPDARDAALRRNIERQKLDEETYHKRLETLPGTKRIEDLLRITGEGGRLVIKSPLFDPDESAKLRNRQVRAQVEGFEGYCVLMVQPVGKGAYYFTFANTRYPDLRAVHRLSVSTQPGYVQIGRNLSSATRNQSVNLVQSQGRSAYGQADGVQLNVYAGDDNGHMTESVSVSEPDFPTLRRKHPRLVSEYLRPLLRELKLESLFAIDPMTAWQVFADDWTGNEPVAARIRALLPALESDRYTDREAARQAVARLGPDVPLVIYKMDRAGLTPEQNAQLDAVMSTQPFLSRPDAQRMLSDADFLLDCLYSPDPAIRTIAARHLHRVTGRKVHVNPSDDYDARAAKVEPLRADLLRTPPATNPAR